MQNKNFVEKTAHFISNAKLIQSSRFIKSHCNVKVKSVGVEVFVGIFLNEILMNVF